MKKIDVCYSPELINQFDLTDRCIVVIDILRATSCMVAGLGSGVESITPVATVEECEALGTQGYVMAGERGGQKLPQFDIGNSPFDYMKREFRGKRIAATTTNGTRCIELSKGGSEIVIGAFLNLSAVVNHLKDQSRNVLLFCAGWKGRFNLEDSLFAGAVCYSLRNDFELESDAAIGALAMYNSMKVDITAAISNSDHAKRLGRFGIQKDIQYCSRIDEFETIPTLVSDRLVINS